MYKKRKCWRRRHQQRGDLPSRLWGVWWPVAATQRSVNSPNYSPPYNKHQQCTLNLCEKANRGGWLDGWRHHLPPVSVSAPSTRSLRATTTRVATLSADRISLALWSLHQYWPSLSGAHDMSLLLRCCCGGRRDDDDNALWVISLSATII